jgi:hypothetical protein
VKIWVAHAVRTSELDDHELPAVVLEEARKAGEEYVIVDSDRMASRIPTSQCPCKPTIRRFQPDDNVWIVRHRSPGDADRVSELVRALVDELGVTL